MHFWKVFSTFSQLKALTWPLHSLEKVVLSIKMAVKSQQKILISKITFEERRKVSFSNAENAILWSFENHARGHSYNFNGFLQRKN